MVWITRRLLKMKPISVWLAVLLLAVIAGLAIVVFVQRVQLYVIQHDVERLEISLEEDNCWYEEDHYFPASEAGHSGSTL